LRKIDMPDKSKLQVASEELGNVVASMRLRLFDFPEIFWVVTRPSGTVRPEMADVLWETNLMSFAFAVKGGYEPEKIVAVYGKKSDAEKRAQEVFQKAKELWES